MPKTLTKFCELVAKAGKDSLGDYVCYLKRMASMYGFDFQNEDYNNTYLAMWNRRIELLKI